MENKDITIIEINELTDRLLEARKVANMAHDRYELYAGKRDELQAALLEALRESEIKSIKRADQTVGYAERYGLAVRDERALIKWLDENNMGNYVARRADMALVKTRFSLSKMSREGTPPPAGTEITKTDYITIRANKKAE